MCSLSLSVCVCVCINVGERERTGRKTKQKYRLVFFFLFFGFFALLFSTQTHKNIRLSDEDSRTNVFLGGELRSCETPKNVWARAAGECSNSKRLSCCPSILTMFSAFSCSIHLVGTRIQCIHTVHFLANHTYTISREHSRNTHANRIQIKETKPHGLLFEVEIDSAVVELATVQ